ncbi:pathogenicity island effector protein [Vibrio neptunius]|uniref:pathogenicity island effector protein n=1 Tax=Vibrio neptunius TaxID=170651 RepID=UPI0019D2979D|nr:pathogenicity island effector protein [Vibrio neptunius]MBN3571851.1 pathogenicity island effector protein [Vibrio neptunius]QXX05603.1 pathogenicity island effector protein [Vibrio neptunius]
MSEVQVSNNAPVNASSHTGYDQDVSGSEAMDAISQLNELIIKLAEIFKKLRNVLQEYNQKQQLLGWDVQKASMDTKRDAIKSAFESAAWSGGLQILSGAIGMVGVGATSKFGEGATHLGQALGKGVDGAGSMVSASITKDAEMEKMDGEFKALNAQNYAKNVNELSDKARQISEQMRSLVKELVELHGRIASAVHN